MKLVDEFAVSRGYKPLSLDIFTDAFFESVKSGKITAKEIGQLFREANESCFKKTGNDKVSQIVKDYFKTIEPIKFELGERLKSKLMEIGRRILDGTFNGIYG